jgi:hypothetical protein
VIPDHLISEAVLHLLSTNRFNNNQKSFFNAIMLELQRSETVLMKVVPRVLGVLKQLKKNSVIFESVLDTVSDYVSLFPKAQMLYPDTVAFLEEHHLTTSVSGNKHLRLSGASSMNVRMAWKISEILVTSIASFKPCL